MPKVNESKKKPVPELTYELEGAPPKLFLVWSGNLEMWVAPNGSSFTPYLVGAGTFAETRANELAADQSLGSSLSVTPLTDAVREHVTGANPVVLQAIAALGGR